ncbi:MAG: serine/threonine-protein kinase [Mariprofundaceae bacterium]
MKRYDLFKYEWSIGLVVAVLFFAAYALNISPLQNLENKLYDMAVASNTVPANDQIILIAIDDESIQRIGPWPWSHKVFSDMIQKVSAAGARLIGVDILFEGSQASPSLEALKTLSQLLHKGGQDEESRKLFAEARKALDVNQVLVEAVTTAGNVVMPFQFTTTGGKSGNSPTLPEFVKPIAPYNVDHGEQEKTGILRAGRLNFPFPALGNAAAGLGYHTYASDKGNVTRATPLIIQSGDSYLPSMPLMLGAMRQNLGMKDIRITLGKKIELGSLDIHVDNGMNIYPTYCQAKGNGSAFTSYPFHDVFTGRVSADKFKGKTVLIGATAAGIGKTFATPVRADMPRLELTAHVLNAIMNEAVYTRPSWAIATEIFLLLFAALYLALVLPRLAGAPAMMISLASIGAFMGLGFVLIGSSAAWVHVMTPACMLFVGHIVFSSRTFVAEVLAGRSRAGEVDLHHTNKMLGLSFQSQGLLDMAYEKYRKCHLDDDMLGIVYSLAIDFENKRQFNKAISVYEHIAKADPNYKDIQARAERAKMAGDTMILSSKTQGVSTLLVSGDNKPMLGRYEIIKELGKGAMGTVYLGRDPKINREVAIKTMALSQEFDASELEDIKDRFFREAETAGRLRHPNIVTIYDAGEEHDLAYIAMEFLHGSDLTPFTKAAKLMAPSAVLKICGKVAEALHYAHDMKVVHRDIKPGNIMLLKDRSIKVTDFGIARLTVATRTKTGVVLGTPSYMSPEQLSGKHIDGRSDLFSLGVTLYEMLAGTRPFSGDSMATLMFQIANEPHADIRDHRPELPESIAKLIDMSLTKNMDSRFNSGTEMVQAIIGCLRDLAAKEKTA